MTDPSKEFFEQFENNLVKGTTTSATKVYDVEEIEYVSTQIDTDIELSDAMRLLLVELRKTMLLNNLRNSELLVEIKDQGFAEGMSKDAIRNLIVSALKDIVGLGPRQIQRLLPVELKHMEFANKAVMMTGSPDDYFMKKLDAGKTYWLELAEEFPDRKDQIIQSLIELQQELLQQ
jgi:hypothetical protein